MAAGPSYMVVSDTFPDLLPQFGQVGVELRNIVLEQRLLHCNESILALDDVACVTQRIVGVVLSLFYCKCMPENRLCQVGA